MMAFLKKPAGVLADANAQAVPSFRKLRIKLTCLYTLVLAGLAVTMALVLYFTISMNLESTSAHTLQIYAAQLAGAKELALTGGTNAENTGSFDEIAKNLTDNSISYIIWDDNLKAVNQSQGLPLNADNLYTLVNQYFADPNKSGRITDMVNENESLKVCTYTYVSNTGELLVVQLVKNMAVERQVLQQPVLIITIVVIGGILLSIWLGYFLAGRALAPIRQSYLQQRNFLADASHELRTPVSVIQTNLEAVIRHPEDEVDSQMTWLSNAYSETKRMKSVVEDLLFLAKADAGEKIVAMAPVDLSYLILELTERLSGLAEKKHIRLNADLEQAELYINGDEKRISELLTILIDNAVKYTEQDGTVTISAWKILGEGFGKIAVTVCDDGIGIPEAEQEKIFMRFYRVDKARSRAEGGTGLGLSIAKWIAEEHDALISVKSQENEGTCFTVTFNACQPPAADLLEEL